MTPLPPPRLAVALLTRFFHGNESLIGDLLEEFQLRRSPFWLWRQVLLTIVISYSRTPFAAPQWESGPLHLRTSDWGSSYEGPHVHTVRPMTTINMSGIPVCGVGGLGMVATAVLITVVLPQAWWLVISGVVGGILLGILKIVVSRRLGLSGPSDRGGTNMLFGAHAAETPRPGPARVPYPHRGTELTVGRI